VDYTSPDMKLITPESAQFKFPNIQLNPPEAMPSRPGDHPPEEEPPWEPNPLPPPQRPIDPMTPPVGAPGGSGPIYDDSWIRDELDKLRDLIKPQYLGVNGSKYILTEGDGFTGKQDIILDAEDSELHCTFEGGVVKSKRFQADNYETEEPGTRLEIKEQSGATLFELTSGKPEFTTYVKDIWFEGGKIKVQYEMGGVYKPEDVGTDDSNLPIVECDPTTSPTPI
jgi:hypothetical protein